MGPRTLLTVRDFGVMYDDIIRMYQATGTGVTPTLLTTIKMISGGGHVISQNRFFQQKRYWEDPKLNRFENRNNLSALLRSSVHVFEDEHESGYLGIARHMKRLYDAGVPIQLGGHGNLHGLDSHIEMEYLSHGGFSNMEALAIATIMGARLHGLDDKLGSLEAGKLADLVVLNDNPLEKINNTQNIELVMKNGVLYSGDDAARVYPNPESAGQFYFK